MQLAHQQRVPAAQKKVASLRNMSAARIELQRQLASHNKARNHWRKQRWPLLIAANGGRPPAQPQFSRSIRKDPRYQGAAYGDPRRSSDQDYDPRADPRNAYWPPPFPVYPATWYTPYYGIFSYISGSNGSYGAVTCGSNDGGGCGTAAGGCSGFAWDITTLDNNAGSST